MRKLPSIAVAAIALVIPLAAFAQDNISGRKLAFLVGVNNYRHAKLDPLQYAERDVEELAVVLRNQGYRVTLLTPSAGKQDQKFFPSRDNIEARLKEILKGVGREDQILIGLAGHGLQPDGSAESYYCPFDANPGIDQGRGGEPAKARYGETLVAITGKQGLLSKLDDSGIGRKMLLIDACRNDPESGRGRGVGSSITELPDRTWLLLSCSARQRAWETGKLGGGHGVFFHYVLQGLKGEAADKKGRITWPQLAQYVTEQVESQVPAVIGDGAMQSPDEKRSGNGVPVLAMVTRRIDPIVPEVPIRIKAEPKILFERAKTKHEQKDYLGEIVDLTDIIEQEPKNATAYFERALAKDKLSLPVFAINDLDRVIEFNPSHIEAYENRERIRYANSIGNWSLIRKDIDQALALGSTNPLMLRHRATHRAMTGDQQGALVDFENYLKKDPKDRWYGNGFRGQVRLRFGDANGAIADLTRDISTGPLDYSWLHRALAYLAINDKARAESDFAEYLKKVKDGQSSVNEYREIARIIGQTPLLKSAPAYVKRAEQFYNKKWYMNAVADCAWAQVYDRSHVPALVLKGKALRELSLYEEAMDTYTRAANLEPSNPEHVYLRGWCAWQIDKYDQGITDCNLALKLDDRHLNALNIKALCYYSQDNFDEAIRLHVLCSEITPTDSVIWSNLADDYVRVGEYEKAIAACNKSLELTPNQTRAYELRAKANWGLEKLEDAQADFARCISASPPNDNSAYLTRARFEIATQQFNAALADLQRAGELSKYHAEVPRLMSLLKYAMGDSAGSAQEISRTLMLNSGHYLNFATRGALLLKASRDFEADRDFEQAARISPQFRAQLPALKEAILARGPAIALLEQAKPRRGGPIAGTVIPDPLPAPVPQSIASSSVPVSVQKFFNDGLKLYQNGKYAEAVSQFTRAKTAYSRYAEAFLYRGLCYQRLGKSLEAERDFAEAVRINSSLKSKIDQERARIKR